MISKCCVNIIVLFLIGLLLPFPIHAQNCLYNELIDLNSNHPNLLRCWPPGSAIGYYYSACDEPFADSKTEAEDAASSWSGPSGYSIKGKTTGASGDIIWINDTVEWDFHGHSANAAAATRPYFNESGSYLNGFLIHMNCAYFSPGEWSGICESGKIDLESIILHEFGHVLGLKDVACTNTVMNESYSLSDGCRQTLHDIDKEAIKYLHDNSAGRLVDFKPVLRDGAVDITWEIISHNADHYYLERRLTVGDIFRSIEGAVFYPDALGKPGKYEYTDLLGSPDAIYRLVEQERNGHIIIHAIEKPLLPFDYDPTPPLTFDAEKIKKYLKQFAENSRVKVNVGSGQQYTTEDWVAIGPLEYINSDGILALAYWHGQYGLTTGITILQHIDEYWGGDLKAYINYLYEHGTQYVVLVGDANDYLLWDDESVWSVNGWDEIKPDYTSQPEYDIISTDYFLDQEFPDCSMSYFTPYYASELPKADVDDDGIPEIVVGRIPAHSVDDVLAYGAKAVKYLQNPDGPWVDEISVWIDCRHMAGNDGYFADSLGMDLLNYLPAGYNKHIIKNSPCPDCLGYSEREAMAIAEFNEGRSLIVSFGTIANCYRLNDWFDVRNGFTVSKLEPNDIFPFLLAISCEQGAFDETESPTSGRPICERLLFDDSRGVIGMFAPTRGTWQKGNYLMGKLVLEYLYCWGAQSLGHACLAAQRKLIWQEPKYNDLARSYVFLGDPALFLSGSVPGEITSVNDEPVPALGFYLRTNYPNPFNPSTTIEYSVVMAGKIDLMIYDVKGRLVKELYLGIRDAGVYTARWDGTNSRGKKVASGIYFCRLRAKGKEPLIRKMVLIR